MIFPELSLTGYEPALAEKLAMRIDDQRLDIFQEICDEKNIAVGIGMPVRMEKGVAIGMAIFQPDNPRRLYLKQYLHSDEEAFFVSGKGDIRYIGNNRGIGLAVCYEISVPEHLGMVLSEKPAVYLASVAKFTRGIDAAFQRLHHIARENRITVMMVNCVGECDGAVCAGGSSVWDEEGNVLGRLDSHGEGLITLDIPKGNIDLIIF